MARLRALLAARLLLALAAAVAVLRPAAASSDVRVLFLTDCTFYSDWQALGDVYSFKKSGQPGKVTRVMCCTPDEKEKYLKERKEMLDLMDTHIAPSFTMHPRTKDVYAAYNKPEAVIDYMEHVTPEEEWMLVLDSDMLIRKPFTYEQFKARKGMGVGARYDYMIGVNNELAVRHVPEVLPRNDTLAGPLGRRGDQVGGFFFLHRDDLKALSHGWLKYTEDVRADPEAWHLSGDSYSTHPGDKPWISEMYGYAFGASKADVWHKWDQTSMLYPGYNPAEPPKLLHYGLYWDIKKGDSKWAFDKHWHYGFDVLKCPPWEFDGTPTAGIFPLPPHPDDLKTNDFLQYYRDLIAAEAVITMDAALCELHLKRCPHTQELLDKCGKVKKWEAAMDDIMANVEDDFYCRDHYDGCAGWAAEGECKKNPTFMLARCKVSCKECVPHAKKSVAGVAAAQSTSKDVIPGQNRTAIQHEGRPPYSPPADSAATIAKAQKQQDAAVAAEKKIADQRKAQQRARDAAEWLKMEKEAKAREEAQKKVDAEKVKQQQEFAAAEKRKLEAGKAGGVQQAVAKQQGVQQQQQQQQQVAQSPPKGLQQKHVEADIQRDLVNGVINAGSGVAKVTARPKSVKDLIRRCYRMQGLPLDQVKACISDAKAGKEFVAPPKAAPPKAKVHAPQEEEKVLGGDFAGGSTTKVAEAVSTPVEEQPKEGQQVVQRRRLMSAAHSWPAVSVWVLLLAGIGWYLPRFIRRRRARSGLRSD